MLVIVGTFFVVLPEIASYSSVVATFRQFSTRELLLLTGLAAFNIFSFAPPLQAALPGLGFWRALSSSQIAAAFSHAVPAGDALGMGAQVAMYRRWGFAAQPIAVALTLVGAMNGLFFAVVPPTAMVLLMLDGERRTSLLLIAIAALVALAALTTTIVRAIRSEAGAYRAGALAARLATPLLRIVRRGAAGDWGTHLVEFRAQAITVLRHRWLGLLLGTALSNIVVFACVVVSLRVCGATADQLSWQEILVAWSLTRLLLLIPITPGGIGVVELGMTGMLVAFGGDSTVVVAGVLLERAVTFLPPIIIGAIFGTTMGINRRGDIVGSPD